LKSEKKMLSRPPFFESFNVLLSISFSSMRPTISFVCDPVESTFASNLFEFSGKPPTKYEVNPRADLKRSTEMRFGSTVFLECDMVIYSCFELNTLCDALYCGSKGGCCGQRSATLDDDSVISSPEMKSCTWAHGVKDV